MEPKGSAPVLTIGARSISTFLAAFCRVFGFIGFRVRQHSFNCEGAPGNVAGAKRYLLYLLSKGTAS